MFATALIVFREVLEAALIIGIVLAAYSGLAVCVFLLRPTGEPRKEI